jgi:hypothetical protein
VWFSDLVLVHIVAEFDVVDQVFPGDHMETICRTEFTVECFSKAML